MNWVKVEFYGLVLNGEVVVGADLLEIGKNLCETFGFAAVDGLVVARTAYDTDRPMTVAKDAHPRLLTRSWKP